MFGFLFGTVCLVALVKVVKGGRHWGGTGHGRRRWALRALYQRLGTTPGQERVIEEAVDELDRKGRALRDELFRSRADVAKAMRAEHFDTAAVREAMDRQQALVDELKSAAVASFQKVHEALNPEQRKQVADLFEFGPGRFAAHGCGPALHGCGGGWHHRAAHGGAVHL